MNYKFLTIFLLLTGLISLRTNAQYLLLETRDGDVFSEKIDSIRKLSLPDNNFVLKMKDNSATSYSLASVKKVYFDLATRVDPIENIPESKELVIYPNPASSFINIHDLPNQPSQVTIYSIQGGVILQKPISAQSNNIDVSSLKNGLYFLNFNRQTVKFIKL
ncbi:MAG: T9SS type A sorting domain-containing protein [Bacteroidales bacterium]|nr:T9SS type A sorting domain-containing protein [Bacteroidales bacterium]